MAADQGTSISTPPSGRSWSGFGDRLRTYLIGVGIGLMLLGGFWMMKKRAQQAQQQGATQQAPMPGGPGGTTVVPGGN